MSSARTEGLIRRSLAGEKLSPEQAREVQAYVKAHQSKNDYMSPMLRFDILMYAVFIMVGFALLKFGSSMDLSIPLLNFLKPRYD